VTLRQAQRGFVADSVSDVSGAYHFASLLPGTYEIGAEAESYVPSELRELVLAVGDRRQVDIELADKSQFVVTALGTAPSVDPARSSQASVISQHLIENLPINRRNYLEFALLTPSVVESTFLVDQFDYRSTLGPTSGLSFGGTSGRSNFVAVDGLSLMGVSGNVRPNIPQIAVQEFQVHRNSYGAELGAAAGGVINIVSTPGTNRWNGQLFGLLRHRSLDARNAFDPEESAYTRQQSGGSISGPVTRNRRFVFAGLERLDRNETNFVTTLQDAGVLTRLTPGQQALVQSLRGFGDPGLAALADGLSTVLRPSSNPTVAPLFETNSGTFPFSSDSTQGMIRYDEILTDRHQLFLRYNRTRERIGNTRLGALSGFSHGASNRIDDDTGAASFVWTGTPTVTATSRVSVSRTGFSIQPNDANGPEVVINGYGTFGRDAYYPYDRRETFWQAQQSFGFILGEHSVRTGVQLEFADGRADVHTNFGGRFVFGEFIPLGALVDQSTGVPGLSAQLAGALTSIGQTTAAKALADPITSLQSYALGLPVAYLQGFGSTDYKDEWQNHAFFVEDSWRAARSLVVNAGLRWQHSGPSFVPSRNVLAPRLSFAWSPSGVRDLVVRAGAGLFYDNFLNTIAYGHKQLTRDDVNLMVVTLEGVPGILNPQTGAPVTSADVWQSLGARGILGTRPLRAEDLAAVGLPPTLKFPITGGADPNYSLPRSQQASLQIEKGVGFWAFGAGAEVSRTAHIWRNRDINLTQTGTRPDGSPIIGRADPLVANRFWFESSANAFYHAFVFQASRRLANRWSLFAHYTLSRAIDEATDMLIEYQPMNQLDARADRGLSPFHIKHRFVAAAVLNSGRKDPWTRNWTLSPIVRANSARPFNVVTGFDNLGDGQTTNKRPLGLGRNAGIGPDLFIVDGRLERRFVLEERFSVALRIEAFNALNRTNFQQVNNVVGNVSLQDLPQPLKARRDLATRPLAYTAAYDPRQIQLGLQLNF
jgi:hypothetical protein